jgi:Transmembrane secretion effector
MAGWGSASSTWAPLRIGLFCTLWIAALVGNLGEWMQTVVYHWLLVHDCRRPGPGSPPTPWRPSRASPIRRPWPPRRCPAPRADHRRAAARRCGLDSLPVQGQRRAAAVPAQVGTRLRPVGLSDGSVRRAGRRSPDLGRHRRSGWASARLPDLRCRHGRRRGDPVVLAVPADRGHGPEPGPLPEPQLRISAGCGSGLVLVQTGTDLQYRDAVRPATTNRPTT